MLLVFFCITPGTSAVLHHHPREPSVWCVWPQGSDRREAPVCCPPSQCPLFCSLLPRGPWHPGGGAWHHALWGPEATDSNSQGTDHQPSNTAAGWGNQVCVWLFKILFIYFFNDRNTPIVECSPGKLFKQWIFGYQNSSPCKAVKGRGIGSKLPPHHIVNTTKVHKKCYSCTYDKQNTE